MQTHRGHASRAALLAAALISIFVIGYAALAAAGDEVRLAPNGELAGPLPASPELRREALVNARRMATASDPAAGGVRYEVTPRAVSMSPAGIVHVKPLPTGAGQGAEQPPIPDIDQTASGSLVIGNLANLPAAGGNVTPGDLSIAADEDYIVTADNERGLLIYDKCGLPLAFLDFSMIEATGVNYGARIHWDEFYKHFAFAFLNVDFGSSTATVYFGPGRKPDRSVDLLLLVVEHALLRLRRHYDRRRQTLHYIQPVHVWRLGIRGLRTSRRRSHGLLRCQPADLVSVPARNQPRERANS